MTYPQAIKFLYDLRLFGAKPGLDPALKLAALAGNPQNQLAFIHVAGTNGKGSTCAMLESIYRESGLRVGLYTSPHLVFFGERIQVNRQPISESDITRLVSQTKTVLGDPRWPDLADIMAKSDSEANRLDSPDQPAHSLALGLPTFFEAVTVIALRYFAEQNCQLVIWETGMEGRLDATNIVTPLASVITNVQFDHQQWLGDTIRKIALEKAGIIKPGVPVITASSG